MCWLQAFGRAGSSKKQQLMQAMIKRMEATKNAGKTPASPGASKRAAPSVTKEEKVEEVAKKKYSMDYSRFDQLEDSDEEEDAPQRSAQTDGPPRDLHKRMPPKFIEAMRYNESVAQRGNRPEELAKSKQLFKEAFEEASPDARSEIWEVRFKE